ncbi:hypothetical protein STEG23_026868 [Scotinomys teguina]
METLSTEVTCVRKGTNNSVGYTFKICPIISPCLTAPSIPSPTLPSAIQLFITPSGVVDSAKMKALEKPVKMNYKEIASQTEEFKALYSFSISILFSTSFSLSPATSLTLVIQEVQMFLQQSVIWVLDSLQLSGFSELRKIWTRFSWQDYTVFLTLFGISTEFQLEMCVEVIMKAHDCTYMADVTLSHPEDTSKICEGEKSLSLKFKSYPEIHEQKSLKCLGKFCFEATILVNFQFFEAELALSIGSQVSNFFHNKTQLLFSLFRVNILISLE